MANSTTPYVQPRTAKNSGRSRRPQRRPAWRWIVGLLLALALLAPGGFPQTARAANSAAASVAEATVPILVKFKAGATSADIDAAVKTNGGQRGRGFDKIRTHVINVPAGARDRILAAFQHQANVERATAAIKLSRAGSPDDPGYAQQWALPKMG